MSTLTEVTHACPPKGSGVMPCCHKTPFEVDPKSRMTMDPDLVTCGKPDVLDELHEQITTQVLDVQDAVVVITSPAALIDAGAAGESLQGQDSNEEGTAMSEQPESTESTEQDGEQESTPQPVNTGDVPNEQQNDQGKETDFGAQQRTGDPDARSGDGDSGTTE